MLVLFLREHRHLDRFGCGDGDTDGYSDPDGGWTTANGADSCPAVVGSSNQDRSGCPDDDGDGYSDPDPSGNNGPAWDVIDGADAFTGNATQWVDADGDTFGDNTSGTFGDSCIGTCLLLLTDMVVQIPTVMVTQTLVQDGPLPTVRMLSSMSLLNGLTKMVMATETMLAE